MRQFDFGQNWADYSASAVTPERVLQARTDFGLLFSGIELVGKTFLDIGFGQGLGLLSAAAAGARVVGCDINPKCAEVLNVNKARFPELRNQEVPIIIGSILDPRTMAAMKSHPCHGPEGFDIVHSWGVLHHTGDMRVAISNAAQLVRPGGHLVLALYNRHWSSPLWLGIKWAYCIAPKWIQRAMVAILYPVIWVAKLAVTGKNPREKERGMDFYYDVIDWVGGYPYEYADIDEIRNFCEALGLVMVRAMPANVPTGCNQFVFSKPPKKYDR